MGLAIMAYSGLKVVENPILDRYGQPLNNKNEWKPAVGMETSESVWPGRGYPINPQKVYRWDNRNCFYVGTYIYYDIWKKQLEDFKGNEAFQELIHFSNSEGVIGSKISKKLRDDFHKYIVEVLDYSAELENEARASFIKIYIIWTIAFEMAAVNGAVELT